MDLALVAYSNQCCVSLERNHVQAELETSYKKRAGVMQGFPSGKEQLASVTTLPH
jgi:hypothetical protein